jgi:hypothetical protein
MRQITVLIIFGILTVFSCEEKNFSPNSDNVSPNLDEYRISKILNYPNSSSNSPGGGLDYTYGQNGNLVKETTIEYPITVITYKDYEYTNNKKSRVKIYDGQVGNLTLGTYIDYFYTNDKLTKEELHLSDGTLKYSTIYQYDGDKLIDTYKDGDGLGIHHQYKYTFDNKNRLTSEQVYMYDQELSEFTKYFYGNNDRLIKTELYDHNSLLTSYVENVYEGANNLPRKELQYNNNGSLTQTRELTYDKWRNLTETKVNGTCTIFKRKYNGRLLTEQITYATSWGCAEWSVNRYEYVKK